jgi:hypothetical protein
MGMFDFVECPPELLPDGFVPDGYPFGEENFQTKCFDRTMATYRITPEGKLEVYVWDNVPTGKWFVYDFDKGLGNVVYVDPPRQGPGTEGPYQETERQNHRWVEYHNVDGSPYSGEFNFYASERGPSGGGIGATDDKWHEYIATFENGQLVGIRDDSERMERALANLKKRKGSEDAVVEASS